MAKKKKENFLDYVPICAPGYSWDVDEKGIVVIKVENKGFYNKIAQKFFKKPPVSYISLDEYGSFVWKQMDGKQTIFEIAQMVKENYKEKAEPLYERISKYFQILYTSHLIGYVKEKKK